jgi:thymidylate synthase|tara:strand:- start:2289 stop:3206 length:918 start_codon:yes stop_codon:yes gene_type:complete
MLSRALESIKFRNNQKHDENQYIALIDDIIKHGDMVDGRNGKTLSVFGSSMHFSLENGELPLLTTKKVAWKTCLKELLWFISGSTNNDLLNEQNVKIWNGNSSREFLDSRGLVNNRVNDLGPVYGHQWRFFNADYTTCDDTYNGKGVDQLDYIIKQLKDPKERYSRRLLMSAWNPGQLNEMALPPCHVLVQFNVLPGDKLSCSLYQRSGDVGLGVPFNIASYSFLTHLIAIHCGLKAHEFCYHLGNCHIYDDHIDQLKIQRNKEPYKFPKLLIKQKRDDINNYIVDDFEINDYKSHEPIKMNMRN